MTAPTHIAFAVATGLLGGAPGYATKLLAGGALLPDIDHPQSAVGRVFFFISYPLNRVFGHRRHIHSLVIWLPVSVLGFMLWPPIGWIGLGAISHIIIDCWNLSGVAMLLPITDKVFVLASKKYRIQVASRNEFIVMMGLGVLAWSGGYIGSMGGMRAILATLFGSYEMAIQRYEFEGTCVCSLEGKIRYPDGNIESGTWLIVGTEGAKRLAIYDSSKDKVLHIPYDGKFLKAKLKRSDEKWQTLRLQGPAEIINISDSARAFFRAGKKWIVARRGDVVMGFVIHQGNLEIEALGRPLEGADGGVGGGGF